MISDNTNVLSVLTKLFVNMTGHDWPTYPIAIGKNMANALFPKTDKRHTTSSDTHTPELSMVIQLCKVRKKF